MKYELARPRIKSGDVLAWSHKSWKTWYDIKVQIIRIATQSEYCHVGMAWVIGDRVFVIESVTPKIRIVPLSSFLPFYWVPTDLDWTNKVEEYALSHVGLGEYSQYEAILAGLNSDPGETNKWQCAKYVMAVLAQAGVHLSQSPTPSNVIEELGKLGKPVYLISDGL